MRVVGLPGRVDDGRVSHPGGDARRVAVGLPRGLAAGSYLTTYRVLSDDGHVVTGSLVFSVRRRGDPLSLARLGSGPSVGSVTNGFEDAMRTVGDLAMALCVGLGAFTLTVWRPALAAVAGGTQWCESSHRAARAIGAALLVAAVAGALASLAGLVLQAAAATGASFWAALHGSALGDALATRSGVAELVRAGAFAAIAAGLALAGPALHSSVAALRPVSLGADGLALGPVSPHAAAVAALPLGYLLLTPAIAGHASSQRPAVALVPLDVLHVGAVSVWIGGLAGLTLVGAVAARVLAPPDRLAVVLAAARRLSGVALAAVAVLAVTGAAQACLLLRSWHGLAHSHYGSGVVAKASLLVVLVALGAASRARVRRSRSLAPTLAAELALLADVLGVTGILAGYAPPASVRPGPALATGRLGALQLQVTVTPARPGINRLDIYLLRPDGTPASGVDELDATVSLPARRLGPLPVTAASQGPGHFVIDDGVDFGAAGRWLLRIAGRGRSGAVESCRRGRRENAA